MYDTVKQSVTYLFIRGNVFICQTTSHPDFKCITLLAVSLRRALPACRISCEILRLCSAASEICLLSVAQSDTL